MIITRDSSIMHPAYTVSFSVAFLYNSGYLIPGRAKHKPFLVQRQIYDVAAGVHCYGTRFPFDRLLPLGLRRNAGP